MSEFIINVTNPSGDEGSVVPDIGFNYTEKLNDVNEATIKISSLGAVRRGLLVVGSIVEIKRDGVRKFYGLVDDTEKFKGGTIVFHASGWEIWNSKENGDYANSPYQNTASATIASEIIAESTKFTAGTIEAGINIDFRLSLSDSLWNGLTNLVRKTSQDIGIDYINFEIDVLDHKGSATSVATFNEGLQISDVRFSTGYPRATIVKVFGKGDGSNQITATATAAAPIITQFGSVTFPIIDRTVMSTSEAQDLADAELLVMQQPTKIHDFEVHNFNQSFVVGDVITLNAKDIDLDNEEVRIVGINRGEEGKNEFLTLQVVNPELKQAVQTRNQILGRVQKENRDTTTYMQGSGNTLTWARGINAKNGAPLTLPFQVPSAFITDEAGNIRVDSFTVDYDIDPYKKGVGTASYDGSDPQVQNSSASTAPTINNNSGNTAPTVNNSSGSTAPLVTGSSAESNDKTWGTAYSANSASVGSGTLTTSWATITNTANINVTSDLILYYLSIKNTNVTIDRDVRVRASIKGVFYPSSAGTFTRVDSGNTVTIPILIPVNVDGDGVFVQASASGNMDYEVTWNFQILSKHTHNDGSYAAESHTHDDGSYAVANHLHDDGTYAAASHPHADGTYDINASDIDNISIGDDVSDAGSVNASEVDIFVDFWNGSSWINKHSIINTGLTLDTDVDVSNGGTLPDAAGFWRVRIEPDSASADYVQVISKMKHNLDN